MSVMSDEVTIAMIDMLKPTLGSMPGSDADKIVNTVADLLYSYTEQGKDNV